MTTRNNITIPATAPINQYGAVLARWLGVSSADLGMVFPDLGNFGGDWAGALNFLDVPDLVAMGG